MTEFLVRLTASLAAVVLGFTLIVVATNPLSAVTGLLVIIIASAFGALTVPDPPSRKE